MEKYIEIVGIISSILIFMSLGYLYIVKSELVTWPEILIALAVFFLIHAFSRLAGLTKQEELAAYFSFTRALVSIYLVYVMSTRFVFSRPDKVNNEVLELREKLKKEEQKRESLKALCIKFKTLAETKEFLEENKSQLAALKNQYYREDVNA